VQCTALRVVGPHRPLDPIDRQAADARGALVAHFRQAALRLLLILIIGAKHIEARLLLVVERLKELHERWTTVRTACSMSTSQAETVCCTLPVRVRKMFRQRMKPSHGGRVTSASAPKQRFPRAADPRRPLNKILAMPRQSCFIPPQAR
jgi:hypothetical protein